MWRGGIMFSHDCRRKWLCPWRRRDIIAINNDNNAFFFISNRKWTVSHACGAIKYSTRYETVWSSAIIENIKLNKNCTWNNNVTVDYGTVNMTSSVSVKDLKRLELEVTHSVLHSGKGEEGLFTMVPRLDINNLINRTRRLVKSNWKL